ncbi:nucleoside 2-deoxyribosyltransferase [Halosimplex pelagicum]|uniref:Nucleoside 2-deoxyribosyltransferase n=1 Tax=Halosimplex pelagicum TaxID=869886 RepID=A0A7D5P8C5_9EURY|nr:nucleoside 2-deoxyribosyltransferase [Halosimplex pelagicum]QLH83417.1 nucleoside 2-deoxyribosyltransferase [Halosimplex pelagicum]
MSDQKECFVICPIGSEGSEIRERSDKLMEYIITDAVSEFGYSTLRSDEMSEPGSITSQIIQKTIESELVIADLTNHNPNVFYELALRHATAKPYIQLIDKKQSIPFDISDLRTINYDFDVQRAANAVDEIKEHLETIEEKEPDFDNPISRSADLKSWRESEDPSEQNFADILDGLNSLNKRIDKLESEMSNSGTQQVLSSSSAFESFDPSDFDLSEQEREEIKEEYGVSFKRASSN